MNIDEFHLNNMEAASAAVEYKGGINTSMVALLDNGATIMCDRPYRDDDDYNDGLRLYGNILDAFQARYVSLLSQALQAERDPNRPDDPRHRSDRKSVLLVLTMSASGEKRGSFRDERKWKNIGGYDFNLFRPLLPSSKCEAAQYLMEAVGFPPWFHIIDPWPERTQEEKARIIKSLDKTGNAILAKIMARHEANK